MARLRTPTSVYHHKILASLLRRPIREAYFQDPFPGYVSCDAYPRQTSPNKASDLTRY